MLDDRHQKCGADVIYRSHLRYSTKLRTQVAVFPAFRRGGHARLGRGCVGQRRGPAVLFRPIDVKKASVSGRRILDQPLCA